MPTRKLNTIFLNDSFMLQWDYWAPAIVSGPFRRPQDWRRRSLSRGRYGGRCQRYLQEHHQRPAAVGMLADTNRRQPPCHRIRRLPTCRPASSTCTGADMTDATGVLVFHRGDRVWCRINARANLSWTLPASRPRQRPRGSRDPRESPISVWPCWSLSSTPPR